MSFPITCTACNKTFTISDEIYEKKVAGRVVTIKCKSCSAGIRVDGTKGGAAATAAPATAAAPMVSMGPAVPEAAPAAAPAGEPVWAVDYPDGQDREFTMPEVVAELERGAINGTTLVWRDGMAEWLELAQVPELRGSLAEIEAKKKAAAVAAAKAAAAKAAASAGPVHKPRAPMPTVTGLAGLPGPGVAVRPRPQQPTPAELPKPRAQQPSSPELPKPRAPQPTPVELPKPRAQQPSSPELPKPRAQQPSSPELPKPPAAPSPVAPPVAAPPAPPPPLAPPVAAPPAPPPPLTPPPPVAAMRMPEPKPDMTPPLPASVAKVVSRPPEIQPAFPMAPPSNALAFGTAPAIIADHSTVEWPESKKKTPLVIGGIVVVLALIGGAVALLGGKDEVPPSTPISAVPTPAAAPTATPTSATTSTPTAAAQPGAETASGSDPVAAPADQGATPGAGFAELFAAGARKAESKGATVAPTARFDPAATKVPLAQAATDAQACKQSGGPTGKVTVVVTFDPNGKVSSATITDAPFAGTATATCISAAMKRATVAPFSGLPGTVSKTFSIL
jgi:hypothetical protein